MFETEIGLISSIWSTYFEKDAFNPADKRLSVIGSFVEFFRNSQGQEYIAKARLSRDDSILIDALHLQNLLPFDDFVVLLLSRPKDIISCISIAISVVVYFSSPTRNRHPKVYRSRFFNVSDDSSFGDLKAVAVGRLVTVAGYVVRSGHSRQLIEGGKFKCLKCGQDTFVSFEDGVYAPPAVCPVKKCVNKFLDFQRSSVIARDYQRIKLQELDTVTAAAPDRKSASGDWDGDYNDKDGVDDNRDASGQGKDPQAANGAPALAARIPRTFEVEVRGDLVNKCVSGDIVRIAGIVKTLQADAPRYDARGIIRESGIHQLYIDAVSIISLKSSSGSGPGSGCETNTSAASFSFPEGDDTAILPSMSSSSSSSQSLSSDDFSASELRQIEAIARSKHSFARLVASLCPTIYGQEMVKAGLLLGLVGGTDSTDSTNQRNSATSDSRKMDVISVRSDIHVLIVGDPGLGKSQLLRAAASVAPRSVLVCGHSVTAAGLTVCVGKADGGDMAIEAGALVLADKGVCCIDELDKIKCDYHALLEAMEQQSISIAKSGMVTSLNSRAAVLAAANPAGGHYTRAKTVCENLKTPAALLSRFDLVFILLDRPDAERDRMISDHIFRDNSRKRPRGDEQKAAKATSFGVGNGNKRRDLDSYENQERDCEAEEEEEEENHLSFSQRLKRHADAFAVQNTGIGGDSSAFFDSSSSSNSGKKRRCRDGPSEEGLLPPHIVRRYIEYAKKHVHPYITKPAAKLLQKMYLTMRAESVLGDSIPVTTRHLESLIRLSQARAKADLREEVTEADAGDVIDLLQESLLDAFTTDYGAVDSKGRKGGLSKAKQIKQLVITLTRESAIRDGSNVFHRNEIAEICHRLRISTDVDDLIEIMRTECYLLLKGPRLYQVQTSA